MQLGELKEQIKKKTLDGVYLFYGDEDYLKRHYLNEIRRAVVTDEGLAPFVHFVYEGEEIDFSRLFAAVETPNMFGDGKLVEWHNAMLRQVKESDLAALASLSESAKENGATVVFSVTEEGFDAGTEKRPSKLMSRLAGMLSPVLFTRSTDTALVGWIRRHFAAEGLAFSSEVPSVILERVGHSMDVLSSEIDKLSAYAKANGLMTVTGKTVEQVSVRTVESDAFSFTNALLDGDLNRAYRYLGDMKMRRVDPILVLGQVSRLYGELLTVALLNEEGLTAKEIAAKLKIHEYKAGLYVKSAKKSGAKALKETLSACMRIDAEMKNGSASYAPLERLVASLSFRTKTPL